MDTIFLPECLEDLYVVQELMKDYIELSDYQVLFEATNPEVANIITNNDKIRTKSTNILERTIDAIGAIISNLINSISNFITMLTMNKDERYALQQFRDAIKQNPALAQKRITAKDFKTIYANYNKQMQKLEQTAKMVAANEDHPIDDAIKEATNFIKNFGSASATIITADVAVKAAESNVETAQALKKLLENEKSAMDTLKKQLGKREANKVKKRIDKASKEIAIRRKKTECTQKVYGSLLDCVADTMKSLTGAGITTRQNITQEIEQLKQDYVDNKISKDEYKKKLAALKEQKSETKDEIKKTLSLGLQFATNKHTGKTVRNVAHLAVDNAIQTKKELAEQEKAATKARKRAAEIERLKREGRLVPDDDPRNRSAASFILGTNKKK